MHLLAGASFHGIPCQREFFLDPGCWWNTHENMALCSEPTVGRTHLWLWVGVVLCSEWNRIYREKALKHHAWALVQCDTSVRRSGGLGHSGETVLCLRIYISKQASSREGTHLQVDVCTYPNSVSCQSLHLYSLKDLLSESWKCKSNVCLILNVITCSNSPICSYFESYEATFFCSVVWLISQNWRSLCFLYISGEWLSMLV